MSTFDGIVAEFPDVRVDYFRASTHHPPPLACFLSHVHSDHLQGLEALKSPFVYCSPATREILLRLEKYPHRMNFAKGILESRVQAYKHLKKLLKTIPLETPTTIELSPGNEIQVTLFDANHCVGAVMFLIEGQGKAVLYTGDVRAEPWWVNSITRNPVLLPYAYGHKRLDKIYLDTSFATMSRLDREFPTKAEGLRELLTKVSNFPKDTIFHFEAWTFGYEEVWIALSSYLDSPIHLDRYRWGLYNSLITAPGLSPCREAPPLVGFHLGNHYKVGCLTSNPDVRLHSCEHGTLCPTVDGNPRVIRIIPIVSRLSDGTEIAEVGIGGGKGDLDQIYELETHDRIATERLMHLCVSKLEDPDTLSKVLRTLTSAIDNEQGRIHLCNSNGTVQDDQEALDGMPLQQLVEMLARLTSDAPASAASAATQSGKTRHVSNAHTVSNIPAAAGNLQQGSQPRTITFPWARHASYLELCELVGAFRPRDIHPCTVDEENWTPEDSMRALFGHLCSDDVFVHDRKMISVWDKRRELRENLDKRKQQETQETQSSGDDGSHDKQRREAKKRRLSPPHHVGSTNRNIAPVAAADAEIRQPSPFPSEVLVSSKKRPEEAPPTRQTSSSASIRTRRDPAEPPMIPGQSATKITRDDELCEDAQEATSPSIREWAARAARNSEGMTWAVFGGLICTGNGHTEEEIEL